MTTTNEVSNTEKLAAGGGETVAWQALTEGERNQAVSEICALGTGFVTPLYAVIEGVERILEHRNAVARAMTAPPAPEAQQAEPRKQLTDEQIKARKPICADFVSFRAGVRSIELDLGIYK